MPIPSASNSYNTGLVGKWHIKLATLKVILPFSTTGIPHSLNVTTSGIRSTRALQFLPTSSSKSDRIEQRTATGLSDVLPFQSRPQPLRPDAHVNYLAQRRVTSPTGNLETEAGGAQRANARRLGSLAVLRAGQRWCRLPTGRSGFAAVACNCQS